MCLIEGIGSSLCNVRIYKPDGKNKNGTDLSFAAVVFYSFFIEVYGRGVSDRYWNHDEVHQIPAEI
jgi:hypothetical protein